MAEEGDILHQILGEDEWETILFSFNVAPVVQDDALVSPPRKRRAIEEPESPLRKELAAGAAIRDCSPGGEWRVADSFYGGTSSEAVKSYGAARRSHNRGFSGAACRICR